jgi:DNA-binding YbaB/EbfC family protein
MFGKIGQMASLLGNLPKLQEEMQKFQQNLGNIVAEGDAGAGAIKVKVNGRFEVLSCKILDAAMVGGDRELLEDLIKAATNQAIQKVRQQVAEEYSKMFAGMGLPAGGIPGMGLPGVT